MLSFMMMTGQSRAGTPKPRPRTPTKGSNHLQNPVSRLTKIVPKGHPSPVFNNQGSECIVRESSQKTEEGTIAKTVGGKTGGFIGELTWQAFRPTSAVAD